MEDLCFHKKSHGRSANVRISKEIHPHDMFHQHIPDDMESRKKANEDIKKQDAKT